MQQLPTVNEMEAALQGEGFFYTENLSKEMIAFHYCEIFLK